MTNMNPKIPGMHPEDIKAALRKRGSSLAAVARTLGVTTSCAAMVIWPGKRSRRVEAEIARVLEMDPLEIWPNRPR